MSSLEGNNNESIQVYVRCRPLLENEKDRPPVLDVHPALNKIIISDKTFSFDKVFGPETGQEHLYREVGSPLIQGVLRGFNCTIMAYGQTGTGKTFTIVGDRAPNQDVIDPDEFSGIIPRTMKDLFDRLKEERRCFNISVTFLELYNEEIYDLLAESDDLMKLKMFDGASENGSVVIHGLQVIPVTCIDDIYAILEKGCKKRHNAATLLNEMSSRSHTIFTAIVELKGESRTMEKSKIAKLNMVDLAGSENIGRSGAVEKRAREAGNINQSLLALSRVITSLCTNEKHIPYRQSKLTRLLRDSLGGQTKTTIIATVSPSIHQLGETLNTLKYALRSKNVMNKPKVNSQVSATSLTKEYMEEMWKQQKTLMNLRSENGYYVDADNWRILNQKSTAAKEEKFKKLSQIEEILKETAEVDFAIAQAEQDIAMGTKILEEKREKKKKMIKDLQQEKEELVTSERVLAALEHTSRHLHGQLHKDLAKEYEVRAEHEKVTKQLSRKLSERKFLFDKFKKMQSSRLKNIEYMKDFKKKVLRGATEVQEQVNSLTAECKSSLHQLQQQLVEYYSYHEKGFADISSLIANLEKENVSFCENLNALSKLQNSSQLQWIDTCKEIAHRSNLNISEFAAFEDLLKAFDRNLSVKFASLKDWKDGLYDKLKEQEQFLHSCLNDLVNLFESLTKKTSDWMRNLAEAYEGYCVIVSEGLNREMTNKNWEEHINALENAVHSLEMFCKMDMEEEFEKHLSAHLKLEGFTNIGMKVTTNMLEFCDSTVKAFNNIQKELESRNLSSDIFPEHVPILTAAASMNCESLNQECFRLSSMTKNFQELEHIPKLEDKEFRSRDECITSYCNQLLKRKESIEETFKQLRIDTNNFTSEQVSLLEKLKASSKQNFESMMSFLSKYISSVEVDLPKRLGQLELCKDQDAGSLDDSKSEDKQLTPTNSEKMMASYNLGCQQNCPFCHRQIPCSSEQFADSASCTSPPIPKKEETLTQQSTESSLFGLEKKSQQSTLEVEKNVNGKKRRRR